MIYVSDFHETPPLRRESQFNEYEAYYQHYCRSIQLLFMCIRLYISLSKVVECSHDLFYIISFENNPA